jgi:hypothetical protein
MIYEEEISFNNKQIEMVNKMKYLGIYINNELNWKNHLNYLEEKNSNLIRLINYINHQANYLPIEKKNYIFFLIKKMIFI